MDKRCEEKRWDESQPKPKPGRQAYKPPQMVRLGDLKEITQSPTSGCGCGCGS